MISRTTLKISSRTNPEMNARTNWLQTKACAEFDQKSLDLPSRMSLEWKSITSTLICESEIKSLMSESKGVSKSYFDLQVRETLLFELGMMSPLTNKHEKEVWAACLHLSFKVRQLHEDWFSKTVNFWRKALVCFFFSLWWTQLITEVFHDLQ